MIIIKEADNGFIVQCLKVGKPEKETVHTNPSQVGEAVYKILKKEAPKPSKAASRQQLRMALQLAKLRLELFDNGIEVDY
ncbi:MAG: hypothetical protein OET79_12990 [Nitrospirota bacterium]|nr:hypothetical protein [Nitrospirota bacterium]